MAQSKQLPGIFKRRAWPWPVVLPVLRWVSGSPGKGEGLRNDGLRPGASPGAAVRTRCSAPPPAVQAGPLPPSPPQARSAAGTPAIWCPSPESPPKSLNDSLPQEGERNLGRREGRGGPCSARSLGGLPGGASPQALGAVSGSSSPAPPARSRLLLEVSC